MQPPLDAEALERIARDRQAFEIAHRVASWAAAATFLGVIVVAAIMDWRYPHLVRSWSEGALLLTIVAQLGLTAIVQHVVERWVFRFKRRQMSRAKMQ